MEHITFEDYLKDHHANGYTGTDDNMPDDYERWLGELDTETLIDLADLWGEAIRKEYEVVD